MDLPPTPEASSGPHRDPDELARIRMTTARIEQRQLERCFADAGLAAGMAVLDVGCGPGDISLTAAALVGPTGRVIAVDADPAMIARARARTAAQGLGNVTFVTAPLEELVLDTTVDAIVGRRILIFLAQPAAVLRRLVTYLRPGGVVAFMEHDYAVEAIAAPPVPLLADFMRWSREYFLRSGWIRPPAGTCTTPCWRPGSKPPSSASRSAASAGRRPRTTRSSPPRCAAVCRS